MNLSLRRSTSALLASSLLLTIGRGATLPFMTIYLSRQYSLSVDLIGYAMTIALTIGVVFSLGFGILADKFDKKRGNDSNLLIVFYVQIMPDDFVMQLHRF